MTILNNEKGEDQNFAVVVEDDVIKYKVANVVDEKEFERLMNIGTRVVNESIAPLVLFDFNKVENFSLKTRASWIRFLKSSQIKKVAIFGCNHFIKMAIFFLIKTINKKNVCVFINEEEALIWFKS